MALPGDCGVTSSAKVTPLRRALIIEDETDIAQLLSLHLRDLQLRVTHCPDGRSGLERALRGTWHLLVLDLTLPALDGLEICRSVRRAAIQTPILILSARGAEHERVLGLENGADDYLSKPFSVREFIARIRVILRRLDAQPASAAESRLLSIADLLINLETRCVQRAGQRIDLTSREFDLLAHLAANAGKVFSRAQLLDQVWGLRTDSYEHTVSSHINRLRAKLERSPDQPEYLLTAWGVGYSFREH